MSIFFPPLSQPERRWWWCLDFFFFSSGRRRRRYFSDVSLGVAFWGDVQVVKLLSSVGVYRPRVVILHGGSGLRLLGSSREKKASRDAQVASHGSQIRRLTRARVLQFFAHRPDQEEGRDTIVVVRCGSSTSSQSPGLTVRRSTSRRTHGTMTELPSCRWRNKTIG